ncbi:RidA family protein [Candidatus Poribacteria bacterium]|nr:RidA family protein [Candidatus Poribacteria bacterium]
MPQIEEKLKAMGLTLPDTPRAVGAYVPAIRVGNLVMTSGQLPTEHGRLNVVGAVGDDGLGIEQGADMARLACLNALAAVKSVAGDLDRVIRVVRLVLYVQSKPHFHGQPVVANGASKFLEELFGEAGRHVRSSVGTNALPMNSPVELELTVELAE